MTHTFAIAEVSRATYDEIRAVLVAAGYQQAIHANSDGEVLDMHGVALRAKPADVFVCDSGAGCTTTARYHDGECRMSSDNRVLTVRGSR